MVKLRKWKNDFYVDCYLFAKEGMNNTQIAEAIGVGALTLRRFLKKRPSLRRAIEKGRGRLKAVEDGKTEMETFGDYVYGRLPPKLRELWNKIHAIQKEPNGIKRMEAMLEKAGTYTRMHLFLYAYICKNFSISAACKTTSVSRKTVDAWIVKEPRFAEIMDEMVKAKGDFVESALFKKIKEGDTPAILFASRTINKHRGYADKTEVEVSGSINHSHSMLDLESLGLPLNVLKIIMEKVREKRAREQVAGAAVIEGVASPILEKSLSGKLSKPVLKKLAYGSSKNGDSNDSDDEEFEQQEQED